MNCLTLLALNALMRTLHKSENIKEKFNNQLNDKIPSK